MTIEDPKNVDVPTELVYLQSFDNNFLLTCTAKLLSIEIIATSSISTGESDNNNYINDTVQVILDKTVLYAQGGGQPSDQGSIQFTIPDGNNNKVDGNLVIEIQISKVTLDRESGIVQHVGNLKDMKVRQQGESNDNVVDERGVIIERNHSRIEQIQQLVPIEDVTVQVDTAIRQIHSECHTAGHIIDAAMARCGLASLKAGKAYHFLQGPYVEYMGTIDNSINKDTLLSELQEQFNNLITEGSLTQIDYLTRDETIQVLSLNDENDDLSMYIDPITQLIRVVTIGEIPCLCGGTHIANSNQLQQWYIIGFKSKKGVVRVRYGQKDSLKQ